MEKIVDVKKEEHTLIPSVWFEFHAIEGYPAVKS
jgi:hypothetical protein